MVIDDTGEVKKMVEEKIPVKHPLVLFYEAIERKIIEYSETLQKDETLYVAVVLNDGTRIVPSSFNYELPETMMITGYDEKNRETEILTSYKNVQFVISKHDKNEGVLRK